MLRIGLLVLALTAGGIAAWLALSFAGEEKTTTTVISTPTPPMPTQEVLVAAADIAQGDTLDDGSIRWQVWPEQAVSAAFILRSDRPDAIETLSGTMVRSRFISSEPILEEKLASAESSFLAAVLPSGKRAVALRVSAENTAGGFILPNDRVDVLHTVTKGEEAGTGSAITRTLLRNIRVLAIDQTAEEDGSDSVVGKTATLELDPAQTEAITAAQAAGMLSLSLRSAADHSEVEVAAEISPVPDIEPDKSFMVRFFRAGRRDLVRIE